MGGHGGSHVHTDNIVKLHEMFLLERVCKLSLPTVQNFLSSNKETNSSRLPRLSDTTQLNQNMDGTLIDSKTKIKYFFRIC